MRTLQAVRQVLYAALTAPPLTYQINDGAPITLSAQNVAARPVWTPAIGGGPQAPSPYVCFAVGGAGHSTLIAERGLRARIWVSSDSGSNAPDDEVTELYEAIRARLHGADDEATSDWLEFAPPSLSRIDTAHALGVAIRRCRELSPGAQPADYEPQSGRWYVSATYEIVAV